MRRFLVLVLLLPMVQAGHVSESVFVSSTSSANYGYDYEEGFDTFNGNLECSAHEDNSDYLGKYVGERTALETWFRIEAAHDGASSVFTAWYSFSDHTPNSNKDASLSDSVYVRLRETGNDWAATLYTRFDGAENVLATGSFGNPNDFRAYSFYVDTQSGTAALRDSGGTDLLAGSFTAPGPLYAQWFTCKSTGNALASLALSPYSSSHRSTQVVAYAPNEAPVIMDATQSPSIVEPTDTVTVYTDATDDHEVASMTLLYAINGGVETTVAMTEASPGTWTASIPPQPNGATVAYTTRGVDDQGQESTGTGGVYVVGSGTPAAKHTGTTGGGGTITESGSLLPLWISLAGVAAAFLLRYLGAGKFLVITAAVAPMLVSLGLVLHERINSVPLPVVFVAGSLVLIVLLRRLRGGAPA